MADTTRDRVRQDPVAQRQMAGIAQRFQRLAALRNVPCDVEMRDGGYVVTTPAGDVTDCGCSVHGLYAWLERQPGVYP